MTTPEEILERLEYIIDPELGVDIVNLGLIYNVEVGPEGTVDITMTLTTASCPLTESMPLAVKRAVSELEGVTDVEVELIWTPPWGPEMMSPRAQAQLGFLR